MFVPELVLQCIMAVQPFATGACLIDSAALEATQKLSGPIVAFPTATTKRMCDNPFNSALVCTRHAQQLLLLPEVHTSALLGALSHMRLVVAVGKGTIGPLNFWVASSAAESIKQAPVANVCTAMMHCSTNSGTNIGNRCLFDQFCSTRGYPTVEWIYCALSNSHNSAHLRQCTQQCTSVRPTRPTVVVAT